ncbi:hypothetical protein RFI_21852 [Reticulomyxa filosa]|uniref:Uncharacterized protein n=1 Tax=Reticulomyxa filosa TaxID=46433 RepID=X6MNU1_RETFI|nr:hypothetical protein RFI_21852 [Reticulomyxa filosa]|eukprot:ETO15514.1 hypothetical protein RFI_21852 [Reticulomyxa filosa]
MSKNTYAHVLENYDVKITAKGAFIPPGRSAKPGQDKLHLIIDGRDERDTELAVRELKQMLNDELRKNQSTHKHGNVGTYGKFAVV